MTCLAALSASLCGAAPASDSVDALHTFYAFGPQRTPTIEALRSAVLSAAAQSRAAQRALESIEANVQAALAAPPSLRPITVPLAAARSNNRINTAAASRVLEMALLYRVRGDRRYFDGAARGFDNFVRTFDPPRVTYGVHSNHQYHALYARDWLLPLAHAYDLLRAALPLDYRHRCASWLKEMTRIIAREDVWRAWSDTTHGAWHVAALGAVGAATQDAALRALAAQRARFMCAQVLGPDGFWPGGSLEFHYTAMRALLAYAEAACSSGDDPYTWSRGPKQEYLALMANAAFMLLDPFGVIPGCDHMVTAPLPGDIYAHVAARYGDALFAAAAARDTDSLSALDVLRYGHVLNSRVPLRARPDYSVVSPTLGWAVLRAFGPQGQNLYARLDYGPHGGATGHADKLGLYLCGNGRRVTSDDDNYAVDSPLRFEWAKQTLAHNTVVIGYRSQLGARNVADAHGAEGKLLLFDRAPGISVVEADARNAYPHAPLSSCRRCLALTPDYCIDVFTIGAVKPITADWVFHGLGKRMILENTLKGESALGNPKVRESILGSSREGYNWIDNVQTYIAHEQWSVAFTAGLRTVMMGQRDTRVLAGESGGSATREGEFVLDRTHTQHTVIARRQNVLRTRFVAVHEILRSDQPTIEGFTRLETGTGALVLEILLPEFKDVFILQPLQKAQEMLIDDHHLVTVDARRYAYGRFRRDDHTPVHSVNLSLRTLE